MIEKYKKFIERVDDDYDHPWDADDDNPWNSDNDDDYYGSSQDDGMEHILNLLRKTIRNSGIEDFFVENKGFDISISVVVSVKEKLSDIMGIFDILYHLKRDIIPQYDSEFDMYQTRDGDTILEFGFYLNEGLEDDWDDEKQTRDKF
jgi:hypothetical protein